MERLHKLLVPTDGTSGGASALAAAVPLATTTGAELVLMRAAVPPSRPLYRPTLRLGSKPLGNAMPGDAARQVKHYVEHVASRLRERGVKVEARGVIGQPGAAIVALAEETDADVIVMSTHSRRGPARSIVGSVADEVVRQSRRPVLLVARGESAGDSDVFAAPATAAAHNPSVLTRSVRR